MRGCHRLAPMTPRPRHLAVLPLPALLLAACTAGPGGLATPGGSAVLVSPSSPAASLSPAESTPPAPVLPPPASPPGETPGTLGGNPGGTPVPGGPGGPALTPAPVGPGSPGASGGIVVPVPVGPVPGGPGASGVVVPVPPPTLVRPVAGLTGIRDIGAESFSATARGSTLQVTVVWWSGPAPCSELADVAVRRSGTDLTLTVREGAAETGIACPAIATRKQTTAAIGTLSPGTYTVTVTGVARPQSVLVGGG